MRGTIFTLSRSWVGIAKIMHTPTQEQETEKSAMRRGKQVNFCRWRAGSTPPNVLHLPVPLKSTFNCSFHFQFYPQMPTKSWQYSAVSVLAYHCGYFLDADLKEIICNGYCPCEVTISAKTVLTLCNDLLFSKLKLADSSYAKSLHID